MYSVYASKSLYSLICGDLWSTRRALACPRPWWQRNSPEICQWTVQKPLPLCHPHPPPENPGNPFGHVLSYFLRSPNFLKISSRSLDSQFYFLTNGIFAWSNKSPPYSITRMQRNVFLPQCLWGDLSGGRHLSDPARGPWGQGSAI